jgi:multidrug resistance efflux pump
MYRTWSSWLLLQAALAVGAVVLVLSGCESSRPSRASVEMPAPVPQIVRQLDGNQALQIGSGQVPGMTLVPVREVELPGILQATGQVAFDDRRIATIISRVTGRIEETRVSQWDTVRRGEPIVKLYSPDLMTAEAEYLQARTTSRLTSRPQINGGALGAAMVSAAKRKLELLGMNDADIASLNAPNPSIWMRAPIGGTVLDNKAIRGAQVSPGDVLYSLGTLDDVWVVANIYEDDLARVHEGEQLEAVVNAIQTISSEASSRVSVLISTRPHIPSRFVARCVIPAAN